MISPFLKRMLPQDRIERLYALRAAARKAGLKLKARNGGSRTVPLLYMAFWEGDKLQAWFFNITEAENWLRAQHGGAA